MSGSSTWNVIVEGVPDTIVDPSAGAIIDSAGPDPPPEPTVNDTDALT